MKKDIFEPAPSKKVKPDMVIFEVNDTGREHEYRSHRSKSNYDYDKNFISFLESLGYEIEKCDAYGSDAVIIKDVKFNIDYNNASFASYNIYDRKAKPRKPQNRYIAIKMPWYKGPTIVRIYINKEIDANIVRTKIEKAIKDTNLREQEQINREDQKTKNTQAIYDHYTANADIKNSVSSLNIERNTLNFAILNAVTISVDLKHNLLKVYVWSKEFSNAEDWNGYAENFSFDKIRKMIKTITEYKPLSDELITWATDRTIYLSDFFKNDTDEK